jgi:hypothetical protein
MAAVGSRSGFVAGLLLFSCVLCGIAWASPQSSLLESSSTPPSSATAIPTPSSLQATIPGPQRSLLRMAGVSQKASPDEVLALIARNVSLRGYKYEGPQGKGAKVTEYLVLLRRYVQQARALTALAGPEGVIRIKTCEEAAPLLEILGYRLREACGQATSVETADAEKAFVTIDSGFPLALLEETLRGEKPFIYPFHSSAAPVLFTPSDWITTDQHAKRDKDNEVIDALLEDPVLARLYWALSRVDGETRNQLRQSPGLRKLEPFAAVLDFYGSHICIRSGRVVVPGGAPAEAAWKSLVGADPDNPSKFVTRLVAKDEGWLAAYFDVLSRVGQSQQAYFTDPQRLPKFYQALRGQDLSPNPTRPVFRPNPGLLQLVTRLQWEPNGEPYVPGGLDAWKEIISRRKGESKIVREWAGRANHWTSGEQLLEALFAFSRVNEPNGPLQVYLMLSEIDRGRLPDQRLSPKTTRLLADKFARFSDQFLVFSEFHELNDASVARYLHVAEAVDHISNAVLRTNAVGILQSNVGLWQILARQGQIPDSNFNDCWQGVVAPFAEIHTSAQLFDAGQTSLRQLLRSVAHRPDLTEDEIIALLAGPEQSNPEGKQVRRMLGNRIRSVLEDQRLVSLDTLFALADGLKQMAQGKEGKEQAQLLLPLAREIAGFEMPRPLFTSGERTEWTQGMYDTRHAALQVRTDFVKLLKASASSPKELTEARGELTPFLRNTLVGLNYAYYEPPGAQMLHNNPLFVRSHDFTGQMTLGGEQTWQTPQLFGTGLTANGGAYLAGSLAELPYVLSETEQNFIVPENVQALIWEEMVPGLLTNAILPRWWSVSQHELHAVALYQRAGEELLSNAATDPDLRQKAVAILSDRMLPKRSEQIESALRAGNSAEVVAEIMPGESFYLAAEFQRRFPGDTQVWGPGGKELESLAQQFPGEVNEKRLSEDFGIPHPALTQSYARELLNVKPFPAFMGYSSRLLAESWDSNNLYWARLADEMGYSPAMLNRLIPELTRRMVEKIFASDFEDWPAVLRAMRETGEEFRQGKVGSWPKTASTAER